MLVATSIWPAPIDEYCSILLVPYWTPNVPHSLTDSRGAYATMTTQCNATSRNCLHICTLAGIVMKDFEKNHVQLG
jgi:hypothetical protein